MSKRGGWSYDDARSSAHGEMRCLACNKLITEGEYRYRHKSSKGDWYYQSQHRGCSESDPAWARIDALQVQAVEEANALSRACREFKARWDVEELNDYIRDDDRTNGESHG